MLVNAELKKEENKMTPLVTRCAWIKGLALTIGLIFWSDEMVLAQAEPSAGEITKALKHRLQSSTTKGIVPHALADPPSTPPINHTSGDIPLGSEITDTVQELKLSIKSDKNSYMEGDRPVFTVLSNFDCRLTLTDTDENGEQIILFPNKFENDNNISANVEFRFPRDHARFQYRMKNKGFETVIAVCVEQLVDASDSTVRLDLKSVTRRVTMITPSDANKAIEPMRTIQPNSDKLNVNGKNQRAEIRIEVR